MITKITTTTTAEFFKRHCLVEPSEESVEDFLEREGIILLNRPVCSLPIEIPWSTIRHGYLPVLLRLLGIFASARIGVCQADLDSFIMSATVYRRYSKLFFVEIKKLVVVAKEPL